MPARCHLLVPELLPPRHWSGQALGALRLPALETLLARGDRQSGDARCIEDFLFPRFGIARRHDWPVAPLTLRLDGGAPGGRFWLRADPVHLAVRRDRLVLAAPGAFGVNRDEADALCAALNAHFAADGLRFEPLHPDRWYLGLDRPAEIVTTPLPLATGRCIDGLLPEGGEGPRWRALFNEAQMLMHDHPVNALRQSRGDLPVNSVWFWGGGSLPGAIAAPWATIRADDASARALALHAGCPCAAPPADADAWLGDMGEGEHLAVLDALQLPARYDELNDWGAALQALERDWFAPLLRALGRRIAGLRLITVGDGGSLAFDLPAAARWRFWRPRRRLVAYAAP